MITSKLVTTKADKELQGKAFLVAKKLIATDGYIKGFGNKDRLMSGNHSPIENIETKITRCLIFNNLLVKDGLIFKPTEKIILVKNVKDIQIEDK